MSSPSNSICTRTPAGLVVMRCFGYFFQPGPLLALIELSCFPSVFQIPVPDSQFPDSDSTLPPQTRKMPLPEQFLRTAAALACGAALCACASAPVDDSPARLVICFHGDAKRLDIGERNTLRLYKALTGEMLPYAMLMYVWASDAPVGSIASSVYTEKIQMIVVESGDSRAREWSEFRRNVLEDYRQAFGEEPSDIVAVGVMTDADDTRAKTRAQYGDISFKPAQ